MSNTTTKSPTAAQTAKTLKLHNEGVAFKQIVEQTGLTVGQCDRIIDVDRAQTRLESLGVENVPEAAMFWLGAPLVSREHDAPFIAIATACRDLELTFGEAKTMFDAVAQATSDDAAVAIVADGDWKQERKGNKKTDAEKAAALLSKLSDDEFAAVRASLADKRSEVIAALMVADSDESDDASDDGDDA